ncbi:MAG: transcription termination/antitermination protein NusA [Anaerolineae bacterium]|nr:transcription termination/antitermination protein NusA [Anaerolineae bacterium]MCA9892627.1 transcription termination/antitermination protein NusA [Anaerolineae bacterium]MCB9459419.1 transcription termination/antitermination protein NusA [Anaerolineaceae bacterium]
MANELQVAFKEIAEMRALPREIVLEALQSALVSAYRRDSGASSAQAVEARIDSATGQAQIFVEKEVTDEVITPSTEVLLDKAREFNPEAELGDTVMVLVEHTTKQFGRIAAQTAKQVILQKIREAERKSLYEEYITRQGDLITGTVQSMNSSMVTLSLGRAEATLPRAQQIPGERYRPHDKVRVYLLEVKPSTRGPQIIVSRSHRNMLRRLLEYEVPEIYNGQVEIKSIAREAGYRSKVAVAALQEGIDPVGACVGMRGIRIQNIVKELNDEKIDVIEWNPSAEAFISKALSPARVTGVYLEEDLNQGRTAVVLVPEDQLSLAIGREGQNARLAAKLTGWRIDIKSVTETVEGALENLDLPPLDTLAARHKGLIEEVQAIVAKKQASLTVMQEEYNRMAEFADLVERRLLQEREEARHEELERINAVKSTLPQQLFSLPIEALELGNDLTDAIRPLENVGTIMLLTLIDEDRLQGMIADVPGSPMDAVQVALDEMMEVDLDEMVARYSGKRVVKEEREEAEFVAEAPEAIEEEVAAPVEAVAEEVLEEAADEAEEDEEVLVGAFGGAVIQEPEPEPEVESIEVLEEKEEKLATETDFEQMLVEFNYEDGDELYDQTEEQRSRKKGKNKRRQLVFDEDMGEVVSKRRRKGSRKRNEWDDF